MKMWYIHIGLFPSFYLSLTALLLALMLVIFICLFPELDSWVNQGHHYKTRKETDGDWALLTVGAWDQLMSYSPFCFSLDLARNWNSYDLSPEFSLFKYWFRSPIIKKHSVWKHWEYFETVSASQYLKFMESYLKQREQEKVNRFPHT